jgi:predicted phage tail protein
MAAADDRTLERVLDELKALRTAVDALGQRLAAHPESDVVRTALERVRVLEAREEDARRALNEGRGELKTLTTRVDALERSGVGTGVTITAVHKVAAAALGLITIALVGLVGFLWGR